MVSFFRRLTQVSLLICIVAGSLSTFSLYSMENSKTPEINKKRKFDAIDIIIDVQCNDPITFIQLHSINQIDYERTSDNILGGKDLCGLFATYNGLKMFNATQKGNTPVFCKNTADEIKLFNVWLEEDAVKKIVAANRKRNLQDTQKNIVTYFNEGEIEDLAISLTPDKGANISVIGSNTFEKRASNPNLLGTRVFENIHQFRTLRKPQLILWVCDSHWIPIMLTNVGTWTMDSWANTQRKNCSKVAGVLDFFRSEKIPTAEERNALGRSCNRKSENTQMLPAQRISIDLDDSSNDSEILEQQQIPISLSDSSNDSEILEQQQIPISLDDSSNDSEILEQQQIPISLDDSSNNSEIQEQQQIPISLNDSGSDSELKKALQASIQTLSRPEQEYEKMVKKIPISEQLKFLDEKNKTFGFPVNDKESKGLPIFQYPVLYQSYQNLENFKNYGRKGIYNNLCPIYAIHCAQILTKNYDNQDNFIRLLNDRAAFEITLNQSVCIQQSVENCASLTEDEVETLIEKMFPKGLCNVIVINGSLKRSINANKLDLVTDAQLEAFLGNDNDNSALINQAFKTNEALKLIHDFKAKKRSHLVFIVQVGGGHWITALAKRSLQGTGMLVLFDSLARDRRCDEFIQQMYHALFSDNDQEAQQPPTKKQKLTHNPLPQIKPPMQNQTNIQQNNQSASSCTIQ